MRRFPCFEGHKVPLNDFACPLCFEELQKENTQLKKDIQRAAATYLTGDPTTLERLQPVLDALELLDRTSPKVPCIEGLEKEVFAVMDAYSKFKEGK